MINTLTSALNGLQNAAKQTRQASENIAKLGTDNGADVNFAQEAVTLKLSELAFKANLDVIRVVDELNEEFLSTFDEEV